MGFPWGILILAQGWGTFFWSRCERAALRSRRADPVDVGAAEAGHEHRAMSSVSASAAGSPGVSGPVPTSPRRSRTFPGVTPPGPLAAPRVAALDSPDRRGNAPRRNLRFRGSPRIGRCIALGTDGSRFGDWERWRGQKMGPRRRCRRTFLGLFRARGPSVRRARDAAARVFGPVAGIQGRGAGTDRPVSQIPRSPCPRSPCPRSLGCGPGFEGEPVPLRLRWTCLLRDRRRSHHLDQSLCDRAGAAGIPCADVRRTPHPTPPAARPNRARPPQHLAASPRLPGPLFLCRPPNPARPSRA